MDDSPQRDHDNFGQPTSTGKSMGVVVIAMIAVAMVTTAVFAQINSQAIREKLLTLVPGPAKATLAETYEARPGGPTFDHSAFDAVLKKHVDGDGWIDYAALKSDSAALDGYIATLADAPFDALGRDEKLALLINSYNAFTLRLILDYYPVDSIKDIAESKRWKAKRWKLAGKTYSLDDIEHQWIRPNFKEPRIHFALVCAAVGCPPLRNEAFVGSRIDEQLEAQTQYVHDHETWARYDSSRKRLSLTPLYKWYGDDFEQTHGTVVNFVAGYIPAVKSAIEAGDQVPVSWLEYDWSLNSKQNRQAR